MGSPGSCWESRDSPLQLENHGLTEVGWAGAGAPGGGRMSKPGTRGAEKPQPWRTSVSKEPHTRDAGEGWGRWKGAGQGGQGLVGILHAFCETFL